jgi:hypothetical protein
LQFYDFRPRKENLKFSEDWLKGGSKHQSLRGL